MSSCISHTGNQSSVYWCHTEDDVQSYSIILIKSLKASWEKFLLKVLIIPKTTYMTYVTVTTDRLQDLAWPAEVQTLRNDMQSRQKLKIIRGCLPQFPWNCPQAENKLIIWFLATEPCATLGWNCLSQAFTRNTAQFSFAGHFRHNLVMQPSITLPSLVNNPTHHPRYALTINQERIS